MSRIISFTKLDWRLMKAYWKSIIAVVAIGILLSTLMQSATSLLAFFMLMLANTLAYPFAVSEKNNLDLLYGTLGINKKSVVIGRYLFAGEYILLSGVVALIMSAIISFATGESAVLREILPIASLFVCIIALISAMQFPIYFKKGYTKAKVVAIIPLLLFFALIVFSSFFSDPNAMQLDLMKFIDYMLSNAILVSVALLLLSALFLTISACISYRIYLKKE